MKIKKCLLLLFLVFLLPITAQAEDYKSFDVVGTSDNEYKTEFLVTSYLQVGELLAYRNHALSDYNVACIPTIYKGEPMVGHFRWENPSYIIQSGEQYVNLLFDAMTGKTITLEVYLYGVPNEVEEREALAAIEMAEQETFPTTLTANGLLLSLNSTYDINLNDKIAGSKYTWSSSNEKVAKVNSKNGVVTAISEGTAIITCNVTASDGTEQQLTSAVTVGQDDNFPLLTETVLDLGIGDTFDINLENKIAKSTYKWTSSDRTIAKVNSSNGVVTAIGEGTTNIYCTVTAPDNQIIVLVCEVNVTK